MFEKRLTPGKKWLIGLPVAVTFLAIFMAVFSGMTPGAQPREGVFDIFKRLSARPDGPAISNRYVVVDIDQESLEQLGPWPWPRTQLAELVDVAKNAGAKNVVLTVPVDGPDPLSPEIVGRYWLNQTDEDSSVADVISQLPRNDVALARALTSTRSAVSVGGDLYNDRTDQPNWALGDFFGLDWLTINSDKEQLSLSLPSATTKGAVSEELGFNSIISVSSLPADQDGIVRRIRLIWSAYGKLTPATALAGLIVNEQKVTATPHEVVIYQDGHPLSYLQVGEAMLKLDRTGSLPLYLPQNTTVPTIPAWRAITGNESWRQNMRDVTVFIGESVTEGSMVKTPRGMMNKTHLHVLMADQIADGALIKRPNWAGVSEAGMALLFGLIGIICLIWLSNFVTAIVAASLSTLMVVGCWLTFANTGLLIDPTPAILALAGGLIAFAAGSYSLSLVLDDAVRRDFHGALPASAMQSLQRDKKSTLLNGVRRQVTVLTCSVKLPEKLLQEFNEQPDDYMLFRAQTNDKLRQTILSLGGTVDYAEDGRLLAYWNAPEENAEHIEKACSCALKMIEDLNTLAQDAERSRSTFSLSNIAGHGEDSPFEEGNLEIGIASGVCFAGPAGKGGRNRYTVIGQAVNFASALQERAELYGPAIICDETVFATLRHHFAFLDLDSVTINDENAPKQVYGLVGNPFLKASKTFRKTADIQRDLVNAWREGDLTAAKTSLAELEAIPSTSPAFISLYKSRLELAAKGQIAHWKGSQKLYL